MTGCGVTEVPQSQGCPAVSRRSCVRQGVANPSSAHHTCGLCAGPSSLCSQSPPGCPGTSILSFFTDNNANKLGAKRVSKERTVWNKNCFCLASVNGDPPAYLVCWLEWDSQAQDHLAGVTALDHPSCLSHHPPPSECSAWKEKVSKAFVSGTITLNMVTIQTSVQTQKRFT